MRRVDLLAPAGVQDALRTDGGTRYDREVASALSADGWSVRLEELALGASAAGFLPRDGASVLLDGALLERPGGPLPGAVPLLHAPPPDRTDVVAALAAAPAIVTTCASTRERVLALLVGVRNPPVVVAPPGVAVTA